MSQKPHNWYEMDDRERKVWLAHERQVEDAEYEQRQSAERAERAEREARRQRDSYQTEMSGFREQLNALQEELDNATEDLSLRDRFLEENGLTKDYADWYSRLPTE